MAGVGVAEGGAEVGQTHTKLTSQHSSGLQLVDLGASHAVLLIQRSDGKAAYRHIAFKSTVVSAVSVACWSCLLRSLSSATAATRGDRLTNQRGDCSELSQWEGR